MPKEEWSLVCLSVRPTINRCFISLLTIVLLRVTRRIECFSYFSPRLVVRPTTSMLVPWHRVLGYNLHDEPPPLHRSITSIGRTTGHRLTPRSLSTAHSASPVVIHHVAIKTRNITTAIQFYSLLGFELVSKFRAGPARAAWLQPTTMVGPRKNNDPSILDTSELSNTTNNVVMNSCRLELLEVPLYMLNDGPGIRVCALNLMDRPEVLGYNHLAVDVTDMMRHQGIVQLSIWINQLNNTSMMTFGKSIRVALPPRQQIIGQYVYELAFVFDPDGCLVECLHQLPTKLAHTIDDGWLPWDGKGFK